MPEPGIRIKGLKEFTAALKDVDKSFGREMGKAAKAAGELIVPAARQRLADMSKQGAKAAPSIRAAASQKGVSIKFGGSGSPGDMAAGAIFGAKQYKQFPAWVGNDWTAGGTGGPYGINAAIREKSPEVIDLYTRIIGDLYKRAAFND